MKAYSVEGMKLLIEQDGGVNNKVVRKLITTVQDGINCYHDFQRRQTIANIVNQLVLRKAEVDLPQLRLYPDIDYLKKAEADTIE